MALTRQGDILLFDEGRLRFTYRYGRWQYWNHDHLIALLRSLMRGQRTPPSSLGALAGAVYRSALDVSFRRTGGLFVVLANQSQGLKGLVGPGDAIQDHPEGGTDWQFDRALPTSSIKTIPRSVLAELASLDGGTVVDKAGRLLSYGAILKTKKLAGSRGTEGSRTKAAIAASHYGVAVKISADGDITIYDRGKKVLST